MKKGFTLVEMLAVIVILGIVITLAVYSSNSVRNSSLEKLLKTKISDLESSAIIYGQENQDIFDSSCTVQGETYSFCKTVTVKKLIDENYYKSTETDEEGNIDLKNNVTNKSMLNDELIIYRKNNSVYAWYKDNQESEE